MRKLITPRQRNMLCLATPAFVPHPMIAGIRENSMWKTGVFHSLVFHLKSCKILFYNNYSEGNVSGASGRDSDQAQISLKQKSFNLNQNSLPLDQQAADLEREFR
ncbi:hypothetical protein E2K80_17985 [Rhodophyticola sp. CCM32]|uniref:hypothetical protein n=1 Tax=Rhodophyticola sp. CCM32 TaxID=2916397 RepID=UPI00107F91DA|nr:hypothetical protein [Rhodophyticola sp. CCM32]QBY02402.1 hypothetical protein E2K80_17985 [Rhodophyticola sp. CCM32]